MSKKIFIEIPTWLGDAVMATPAIENLLEYFKDHEVTILGSFVSSKLFANHKRVNTIIIDETKKEGNRFLNLYKLAKSLGSFESAFSFRKSFSSKFFMFFLLSNNKYQYKRLTKEEIHQAIRYNDFINHSLKTQYKTNDLFINYEKHKYTRPTLGLNPGATYGSAKRWYPEEFSKVAIKLSKEYDIVIFGGPGETQIANDIENELLKNKISNYKNLAGKTSVNELISMIGGLDLFITNDSGPMHIAAAFKIKTISIFGPTKYTETNQWNNPNGQIISKKLSCSPCMKRQCPLKHHECMKSIKAQDVLSLIP
jgi:heptosyltransferase-2